MRADAQVERVHSVYEKDRGGDNPTAMIASRKLRSRGARILLAITIGLLGGMLLAEAGLRFLLFSDVRAVRWLGDRLRRPEFFVDSWDDDFYKLRHAFTPPDARSSQFFDPDLGWGRRDEGRALKGWEGERRRLIVLYGDSFSACVTSKEDCWQGLLKRSDIGYRFRMLNRGSGGYGLDQIWLHVRKSIDHYAPLDPIVVVGVLTGDINRCVLGIRDWTKPRLELRDGRLELRGPIAPDPYTYIEENPIGIRSYLWRFMLYGTSVLPEGWRADPGRKVPEASAIGYELVRNIRDELVQRDIDYFFLLFVDGLDRPTWQEDLLIRAFEELDVPYVNSREALSRSLVPPEDLFNPLPLGHYSPLGNEVVFEVMRSGILRTSDGSSVSSASLNDLFPVARVVKRGNGAIARTARVLRPPFTEAIDASHILLRPGEGGPTEVVFPLDGRFSELTGLLKPSPVGPESGRCAALETRFLLDGVVIAKASLSHGDGPVPLRLVLAQGSELAIVVTRSGAANACDWVYLASPLVR